MIKLEPYASPGEKKESKTRGGKTMCSVLLPLRVLTVKVF